MSDILDLGGRVALVTGAGQGVGRQVALQLADAKGSGGVVVNDYVLARAEAVAEEIRSAGGTALALQCDVSDHAAVKAMVEKAAAELGPVGARAPIPRRSWASRSGRPGPRSGTASSASTSMG